MKLYHYSVVFHPEEEKDVYSVFVPALPGCFSCGDSLMEARYNIREAIELYLETFLEDNISLPKNKKFTLKKGEIVEDITVGIDFEIKTGFSENKKELSYV